MGSTNSIKEVEVDISPDNDQKDLQNDDSQTNTSLEVQNDENQKGHEAENSRDADSPKINPTGGICKIASADYSIDESNIKHAACPKGGDSRGETRPVTIEELKTDGITMSEQGKPEKDDLLKERESRKPLMVENSKNQEDVVSWQPKPNSKEKNLACAVSEETATDQDATKEASTRTQENITLDHSKSEQNLVLENSRSENEESHVSGQPKSKTNDIPEESKAESANSKKMGESLSEQDITLEELNVEKLEIPSKSRDKKQSESEQPNLPEMPEEEILVVSENTEDVEVDQSEYQNVTASEQPISEELSLKESGKSGAKETSASGQSTSEEVSTLNVGGKPIPDTSTGLGETYTKEGSALHQSKSETITFGKPKVDTGNGSVKSNVKETIVSEQSKSEPETVILVAKPKKTAGTRLGGGDDKETIISEQPTPEVVAAEGEAIATKSTLSDRSTSDKLHVLKESNVATDDAKLMIAENQDKKMDKQSIAEQDAKLEQPKMCDRITSGQPKDRDSIVLEHKEFKETTNLQVPVEESNPETNENKMESKLTELAHLGETKPKEIAAQGDPMTEHTNEVSTLDETLTPQQLESKKSLDLDVIGAPAEGHSSISNVDRNSQQDMDNTHERGKEREDKDKDGEYDHDDEMLFLEADTLMNSEAFEELIRLETMRQLEGAVKAQQRLVRACFAAQTKENEIRRSTTILSSQGEHHHLNNVGMSAKKEVKLLDPKTLSSSHRKEEKKTREVTAEKESENVGAPANKKAKISGHITEHLQGSKIKKKNGSKNRTATPKKKAKSSASELATAEYDPSLSAKERIAMRNIFELKQGLLSSKQLPPSNTKVCSNGVKKFQIPLRQYNPLKDLHRSIVQNVRKNATQGDKGAAQDPKRRMYGFLPGQREMLIGIGIKLQTFGEKGDQEHQRILQYSTVDLEPEGNATFEKGNKSLFESVTKVVTPALTWEALEALTEHIKPLVVDTYRPYVCMEQLIAVQPNLPDGAPYQALHLEYPRHDGFGVVIVILALFGDSSKVVVADDCNQGEGMKWSFSLRSGEAYILSGQSRNVCRHGVLCDKASEMKDIKEASRIRSPRKTLILRYGLHSQSFANSELMKHL